MKQNAPLSIRSRGRLLAACLFAPLLAIGHAAASTLIDLSRPVSESLDTITGIYWNFETLYPNPKDASNYNVIKDLTANNYTSYIDALLGTNPLPTLAGGVSRPGTGGYGNAISFKPGSTTGNPRAYTNMPEANSLTMVNTSFTGGLWLQLDSVNSGTQRIILMDRGGLNTSNGVNKGAWAFYLEKNAAGSWLLAFQSNSGTQYSNGFHDASYQPLNLQDGGWHHLGFNYEYRADEANVVTFWLDGVAIGTATLATDISGGGKDTTTQRFSAGERAVSTWQSRLDGSIDDLFVTSGIYGFQAIPEPGTYALLGIAITLAAGARHRSRRQRPATNERL